MNDFQELLLVVNFLLYALCLFYILIAIPVALFKVFITGIKYCKLSKGHKHMLRGKVYLNVILKYELKSLVFLMQILASYLVVSFNSGYM